MRGLSVLLLSLTFFSGFSGPLEARPVERVPQDGTLDQAIRRVNDRGVILIAAGVYPAPADGFEIRRPGKSFTIRPAGDDDVVVFDGQGIHPILHYVGDGPGTGRRVAFERLIFRNGFSDQTARAGAVTVSNGDAVFVSSVFEDNVAVDGNDARGGALLVRESQARITNCRFVDNASRSQGGALWILDSRVDVAWSQFVGNRVNLPPDHEPNSVGGAIYVLDSAEPADTEVTIHNSRFEGNEAALVGGAIYTFGVWHEPLTTPAARVTVVNSTFVGNRVAPDPCCAQGLIPNGGAIHVEDHATFEIRKSRFEENFAHQGGALSSYRARVEIHDSVFRGNAANVDGPTIPAGGAIIMTSSDFADPSTDFGAINRRNAELVMTHTLLQGNADFLPRQGGCLLANGDLNRMDGMGGVSQDGSEADNRALVELRDVIFSDCDVESSAQLPGFGGAIMTLLADLTLDDSLVTECGALGNGAVGGGVAAFDRSALRIDGTTFARNLAGQRGGALFASSGEVEIRDGFFLENDVTPSTAPGSPGEQIAGATGAALSMAVDNGKDRDITGVVRDSLFVDNVGIPIAEIDFTAGPFNEISYDGNRFRSTAFGNLVFKNGIAGVARSGLTAAQLNNLTIPRNGAPATDKSAGGNTLLGSAPREGRLVAAPSRVLSVHAPGDPAPPEGAFVGYAWSGNTATLAGADLSAASGVAERTAAGPVRLRVNNQNTATATLEAAGCSDGRLMCLSGERFLLEVDWRDFEGRFGNGLVAPVGADDSGLFFFFGAENWEILAKVLNGCPITGHFWLFSAATTNLEYSLRITDTVSGLTKSYFNPLNAAAAAVTDTTALAACDALATDGPAARAAPQALPGETGAMASARLLAELESMLQAAGSGETAVRGAESGGPEQAAKGAPCTPTDTSLCLNNDRFRLEVRWRNFEDEIGPGEVVPFETADSGLFFFFDPDNWEMLVKVLNACGTPFDSFWVFSAATTDVEYTLTVTDTETGEIQEYFNALGVAAPAVTDTQAFMTCP